MEGFPPKSRQVIEDRSHATEAFFRNDGGPPAPLVVFHHIQKTAGTSLRRVVRANMPPADIEVVTRLRTAARTPAELLAWYRNWYASQDEDRRARLCCVMSHSAGFLLPALDRPAEALVLVREPFDRTLSQYHHKRRTRGPERPLAPLEQLYERGASRAGRPRGAGAWGALWDQLCNWQSRSLLSVFYDVSELEHSAGPSADADVWRDRLRDLVERVFLVGVQDRFEQYVQLLAHRYGWQPFVPRAKVNAQRPGLDTSADPLEVILAYNWLDAELYQLCRDTQQRRESEEIGHGNYPALAPSLRRPGGGSRINRLLVITYLLPQPCCRTKTGSSVCPR